MPHLMMECSANLETALDLGALVRGLHEAALATGVFPPGGIRTRLHLARHYRIADGDPQAGFIHVLVRIGQGRDLPTRQRAGERIFAALTEATDALYRARPLALSLEMEEIAAETSFKRNNLHERLKAKAG